MQRTRKYSDAKLNVAVEELSGYRERQRRIEELTEKLREYEETYAEIKAIAYDIERVAGGERRDKAVETACKWADLDVEIKRLKAENERELWYVKERLSRLTTTKARVLELYYIKGFSLIRVAQIMDYSYDGIKDLKSTALKSYAYS